MIQAPRAETVGGRELLLEVADVEIGGNGGQLVCDYVRRGAPHLAHDCVAMESIGNCETRAGRADSAGVLC
jgi:hypothetical protein